MKLLVTLIAIFCMPVLYAQDSIEKTVGEFQTLKVYDLITVELIASNKNKAIISGAHYQDVVINNKNGKLKIKMPFKAIFDGNDTKVTLYYTGVDQIDANEGSQVIAKDKIKQFEIDLKAQEGAKITVDLDVNYAISKAVTGGTIKATGRAKSQDVNLSTGGVFEGETLKTKNTSVSIKAGGEASVNASEVMECKTRAGGDIYVYGAPTILKENKMLGGRIERVSLKEKS